jgi:hypothetical protein
MIDATIPEGFRKNGNAGTVTSVARVHPGTLAWLHNYHSMSYQDYTQDYLTMETSCTAQTLSKVAAIPS